MSTLAPADLPSLVALHLNSNQIVDASPLLGASSALSELHLDNNQIVSLAGYDSSSSLVPSRVCTLQSIERF